MSILNKYKRWVPQIKILKDKYWDFVLSQSNTPSENLSGDKLSDVCLSTFINMEDERCINGRQVLSDGDYWWENAINEGVKLEDIGFTGIDNGLFTYDKSTITNQEFFNILTNSTLYIAAQDNRLRLNPVSGNSLVYSYESEYDNEGKFYKFNGGFLQGFYKLDGFDYAVLPNKIENAWNLEFVIRPRDYEEKENSLNSTHTDTDGMFFYMGTRAENKFSQFYNSNLDKYPKRKIDEYGDCSNYMTGSYFEFDWDINKDTYNERQKARMLLFAFLYANFSWESNCRHCENCSDREKEVIDACANYLYDLGYFKEEESLSGITIETSDGRTIYNHGYFEIETDNKFLLFHRACGGFLANTWSDDNRVILTGITHGSKENLFLVLHRGKDGKTAQDLEAYYEEQSKNPDSAENAYNVVSDAVNNSFALRVKKDGSIGYRYLIKNCEADNGYKVLEGYSYPNMVKKDEWNVINVAINVLGSDNTCDMNRKMKIYFYVNGKLKFISNELPIFNFSRLDETFDKQEGVPFNISLGGGTQGLCDTIWLDYNKVFEYILPIEENFAGTFIGDIKSFRFYTCGMSFNEIMNNYLYEKRLWQKKA